RPGHERVGRGCQRGINGSLDVVGLVALGRGRLVESQRWFEESFESGNTMQEVESVRTRRGALAETALAGADASASIARCEEGFDIAVTTGERALFIP